MSQDLYGNFRIDVALPPSTGSSAAEHVGEYFDMAGCDRAIFIVSAGSMTASGNVALRLVSSHNSTAASAIAVGIYTTINGTPTAADTVTRANKILVAGTSSDTYSGKTIILNGITYTFISSSAAAITTTTTAFAATRLVWASTDAALPSASMHHLAAYINDSVFGVPGLHAVVSAATCHVIVVADTVGVAGNYGITAVVSSSGQGLYPQESIGYLSLNPAELATSSSQRYVAIGVTPSTVQYLSAMLIRGYNRYSPFENAVVSMAHTT